MQSRRGFRAVAINLEQFGHKVKVTLIGFDRLFLEAREQHRVLDALVPHHVAFPKAQSVGVPHLATVPIGEGQSTPQASIMAS